MVMSRELFGKELYPAACYLAGGLLVDTGIAHLRKDLAAFLKAKHVAAVVNTHAHEDHMGANAVLQAERGLPLYAHPAALAVIARPRLLRLLPYQKLYFGLPAPARAEPIGEVLETGGCRFFVHPAPGHSPDQVMLHEEKHGWLFCGDAFIPGQDRVFRGSYDLAGILATLRRIVELAPETMFTGMGAVLKRPATKVRRKIAYLVESAERASELSKSGLAEKEIARSLFPGDRKVRFVTSGDFTAAKLVRALLRYNLA
jgi:glyoxylase-like metal-dependent hydrolase (beta-lactamase superfamily II)